MWSPFLVWMWLSLFGTSATVSAEESDGATPGTVPIRSKSKFKSKSKSKSKRTGLRAQTTGGPGASKLGGAVGMAGGGMESSGDPELDKARFTAFMMMRRRRYRRVLFDATEGLEQFPTDPALHQMRGVALSEYGCFSDAEVALSEGMGSSAAPIQALAASADTERFLGRPKEAVRLRKELLASGSSPQRELIILSKLFDDYRYDGDLEGMWETVWEAMALHPDAALSHSLAARYYVEAGNPDEAEAEIWSARRREGGPPIVGIAEAEYYLSIGQSGAAVDATQESVGQVLKSKEFASVRARALVADGNIDTAVDLTDMQAWRIAGELWYPDLLAARVMAFAEMGWLDAADDIYRRLASTHPTLQVTADAKQALAQARQRTPGGSP